MLVDGKEINNCLDVDGPEFTTEDGILFKEMRLAQKDFIAPQHSHEYSHTSLVAKGSVKVMRDGDLLGDFKAPAVIHIPAHSQHEFMALEDDTVVYCIHNVSATDGKVKLKELNNFWEGAKCLGA